MTRFALISAGCALLLAACGGGASSNTHPHPSPLTAFTYDPAKAHVPPCANPGKAVPFPDVFPQYFPVPPGTIIDSKRVPIGGGIAAVGFVPEPTFNAVVTFFPRELPKVGLKVLHIEVDSPNDSEGSYSGGGFTGGWSVRRWCSGAMMLQISAKKSG